MIDSRRIAPLVLTLLLVLAGCTATDEDQAPPPAASSREAPAPQTPSQRPPAERIQTPDDPQPAPDVAMQTMDGETIALRDRPGDVLVVNFWATWCAPCRKEIPDLVQLQDDLGPDGLLVIGVSLDQQGAEAVTPFLDSYDINYPIVLDPEGQIEQAFGGVYGLPMTYVIGPTGRIQHRVLGLFPVDDMRPKLTALLEGASTAASG